MIIDVFCHIVPPKYKAALDKTIGPVDMVDTLPTMYDMDERFRIMDKTEGLMQVLTTSLPPLETIPDKKKALALAKMANDEMAELVLKHPDRFAAAIAALPMNDVDAALKEADRAIKDLKFRGVQIFTPINDKPLDSPEFLPLYEKMAQYNLPILIHPHRDADYADYRTEKYSKYSMNTLLGWIYETSAAMIRLIYSGVMEKYPDLKSQRFRRLRRDAPAYPSETTSPQAGGRLSEDVLRRYRHLRQHPGSDVQLCAIWCFAHAVCHRLPL
jgi:predicted TIM-barrel fold metal-dependent hydrolase